MALNDALWERYAIGEDQKIKDPNTKAPATRNVFWKARDAATGWEAQNALEPLQRRGLISLVCNVALGNWATGVARKYQRDPEAVKAEWRENLIPGAILVPSGIYAHGTLQGPRRDPSAGALRRGTERSCCRHGIARQRRSRRK